MKRALLPAMTLVVISGLALVLLRPSAAWPLIASHQCSYCHNLHGAAGAALTNNPQAESLCLTCHGPGGISVMKANVHSNKTPKTSFPAFRVTCRQCHDPHDNVASWTTGTNIKLVGAVTSSRGYAQIVTTNSGTRYVVFQSRGTGTGQPSLHSFADSDQDGNGYYDGVCETCHTQTKYHLNNAPDTKHHTGDTCTSCHAHVDRFMK